MEYLKKFNSVLTSKEKKYFLILLILSIFGSILELIGISLIFPLLDVLVDQNNLNKYGFLNKIIFFNINEMNRSNIISYLLIFISLIYIFRTFYLIFLNYFQNSYTVMVRSRITYEIYTKNILNNFIFFNSRDNSEIMRNIISEAGQFIKGVLNQVLILLLEVCLFIGLIFFLFTINFKTTSIIIIIFGIVGFLYFTLLRRKVRILGHERNKSQTALLKNLINSVKNFIDIRIFEKEKLFSKNFLDSLNLLLNNLKKLSIIQSATRHIIELIIILIFVTAIALFYQDLNKHYTDILFSFVLIVRIYPVFTKIISSLNTIMYSKESINNVYNEILKKKLTFKKENEIKSIKNISLKNINFKFLNSDRNTLDNLSILFENNKSYGIFGNSGSGKTTLLNILSGILDPNSGSILINNEIVKYNEANWRKRVSYVSQNPFFLNDTIQYNISFKDHLDKNENLKLTKSIQLSKLENFMNKNIIDYNYIVGEDGSKLSGGQRQRLGVARAIYKEADLYIFDEATSGIDEKTEISLINNLKTNLKDKILIFISHNKNIMDLCDEIYELKDQKLIKFK